MSNLVAYPEDQFSRVAAHHDVNRELVSMSKSNDYLPAIVITSTPHFQVVDEGIMDTDNPNYSGLVLRLHLSKNVRQDTQISVRAI